MRYYLLRPGYEEGPVFVLYSHSCLESFEPSTFVSSVSSVSYVWIPLLNEYFLRCAFQGTEIAPRNVFRETNMVIEGRPSGQSRACN